MLAQKIDKKTLASSQSTTKVYNVV